MCSQTQKGFAPPIAVGTRIHTQNWCSANRGQQQICTSDVRCGRIRAPRIDTLRVNFDESDVPIPRFESYVPREAASSVAAALKIMQLPYMMRFDDEVVERHNSNSTSTDEVVKTVQSLMVSNESEKNTAIDILNVLKSYDDDSQPPNKFVYTYTPALREVEPGTNVWDVAASPVSGICLNDTTELVNQTQMRVVCGDTSMAAVVTLENTAAAAGGAPAAAEGAGAGGGGAPAAAPAAAEGGAPAAAEGGALVPAEGGAPAAAEGALVPAAEGGAETAVYDNVKVNPEKPCAKSSVTLTVDEALKELEKLSTLHFDASNSLASNISSDDSEYPIKAPSNRINVPGVPIALPHGQLEDLGEFIRTLFTETQSQSKHDTFFTPAGLKNHLKRRFHPTEIIKDADDIQHFIKSSFECVKRLKESVSKLEAFQSMASLRARRRPVRPCQIAVVWSEVAETRCGRTCCASCPCHKTACTAFFAACRVPYTRRCTPS